MPSYQVKQSSTAYPLVFLMVQAADHITGLTGVTPTVTIRKVGGAFGAPVGAVTEIANGWYQVAGNATDSSTLGPLLLHATATGGDPVDQLYEVVAHDVQSATNLGLSALPTVAPGAANGIQINGANTGPFSISNGVTFTNSGGTAFTVRNSSGSGVGMDVSNGGTGVGMQIRGGANNPGLKILGPNGGTGASAVRLTCAAADTGFDSGPAFELISGTGDVMTLVSNAANGNGIKVTANGTGSGLNMTGGATGHGILAMGGATSGDGIRALANLAGSGHGIHGIATGSANAGIYGDGGVTGIGIQAFAAAAGGNVAMRIAGGSTNAGLAILGGPTSGAGISVTTANGHAMVLQASGVSAHGLSITGGTGGVSDGLHCVAGAGGVDIRGTQYSVDVTSVGGVAQTPGDIYAAVTNIAVTSAALNIVASSAVYTTGTSAGGYTNTFANDNVYDAVSQVGNALDFYYQFDLSGTPGAMASGFQLIGYLSGNTNSLNVYFWNWVNSVWDLVGTLKGQSGSTNQTVEDVATSAHTGTGANLGLVRCRLAGTSLTGGAVMRVDRILCGYAVVPLAATSAPPGFSTLTVGAIASGVIGQVLNPPRALDTVPDSALTVNDGLHCAIAVSAGQWAITGTSWPCKTPMGTTTIRTFTLDSATAPTSRT